MENQITVLIVDDHQIIREGLISLLEPYEKIKIVFDAPCVKDAMDYLELTKVDCVISDISMPGKSGIDLVKEIESKKIETKVIMFSMLMDQQYIVEAIQNGASGYVFKTAESTEIIDAINTVMKGDTYLGTKTSEILAKNYLIGQNIVGVMKTVTTREEEILNLIVEGLTNKEIGAELFISDRTVSVHRYNLMKKLNARNTADLVRISLSI